jgi:arginine utilization protein RocB
MNNSYSAGGPIDAWCTKCNLELGHTIVAMVDNFPKKVKCNTCNGQHNYRTKPSERSRTKSKSPTRKTRSKEVTYEEYISRLTGDNPVNAKKYNINGNFEKDEIIDHLKFGIGIVLSVVQVNKIKILFKDGPRLLIQNQ